MEKNLFENICQALLQLYIAENPAIKISYRVRLIKILVVILNQLQMVIIPHFAVFFIT